MPLPLATDNFPGTGTYVNYLLIALAYCLTFALSPDLQVLSMASGGVFWMIWHLLIAQILFQRLKES